MQTRFVYARELDQGTIGINVQHIVSISKGSLKASGEEVTMVRMVTGKEVIVQMTFADFQQMLEGGEV